MGDLPLLVRTVHGTLLGGDPQAPCHGTGSPLIALRVGEAACILAREDATGPVPLRLEVDAASSIPGHALRRLRGGLLSALPDGRVADDRIEIGGWELFSFEPAPSPPARLFGVGDLDTLCRAPDSDAGLLAAHLALAAEAERRARLAALAASRPDFPEIFAHLRRLLSGGAERSPWHTRDHLRDGIEAFGWEVGDHTYGNPTIVETQYGSLSIGRYCSIAGGVRIVLSNHAIDTVTTYPFASLARFWPSAPDDIQADHVGAGVEIGHSVWIGQDAIILSGARIGDGAIVGAGAVVAKPVPPFSVVVGSPGRVTRIRFPPPIVERLLSVAWWHWPDERVDHFIPLLLGGDIEAFLQAAEALDTPPMGS